MSYRTIVLGIAALLPACSSDKVDVAETAILHSCSCGDAETDILGCAGACCLGEDSSCGNPLCTCPTAHTSAEMITPSIDS